MPRFAGCHGIAMKRLTASQVKDMILTPFTRGPYKGPGLNRLLVMRPVLPTTRLRLRTAFGLRASQDGGGGRHWWGPGRHREGRADWHCDTHGARWVGAHVGGCKPG